MPRDGTATDTTVGRTALDPDRATDPTSGQAEFLGALDVRLDLPLATVGSRGMAQYVDLWVVMGIVLVVWMLAFTAAVLAEAALGEDSVGLILAVVVVLGFLVQWGYFFAFELLWKGQTPGKRMFGLRVVELDGSPPGFVPVMVRNLIRLLDLMPGPYGVGAIAAVLSRRGQRLGDMAAGTVVIREDALAPRGPEHTWPDGLGAAEIALLERWARRAPTLLPEVRTELAEALATHLRRTAPGVLPAGEAEPALAALLDREG